MTAVATYPRVVYRVGIRGPMIIARPRRRVRRHGLGDDDGPSFGQQAATGSIAGTLMGLSTAQRSGSAIAGSIAGILAGIAPFTGPAAPFIAGLAALVGPIAMQFQGCGQTCIQATKYADQAGQALETIVRNYFAQPIRTASSRDAALAAVNQVILWIENACSNPALGAAGERCISERVNRDACHWKASPNGFVQDGSGKWTYTPFGPNGSGSACFNYVLAYSDPIKNDPGVVPDPVPAGTGGGAGTSSASLSSLLSGSVAGVPMSILIPAALLGLAVVL